MGAARLNGVEAQPIYEYFSDAMIPATPGLHIIRKPTAAHMTLQPPQTEGVEVLIAAATIAGPGTKHMVDTDPFYVVGNSSAGFPIARAEFQDGLGDPATGVYGLVAVRRSEGLLWFVKFNQNAGFNLIS